MIRTSRNLVRTSSTVGMKCWNKADEGTDGDVGPVTNSPNSFPIERCLDDAVFRFPRAFLYMKYTIYSFYWTITTLLTTALCVIASRSPKNSGSDSPHSEHIPHWRHTVYPMPSLDSNQFNIGFMNEHAVLGAYGHIYVPQITTYRFPLEFAPTRWTVKKWFQEYWKLLASHKFKFQLAWRNEHLPPGSDCRVVVTGTEQSTMICELHIRASEVELDALDGWLKQKLYTSVWLHDKAPSSQPSQVKVEPGDGSMQRGVSYASGLRYTMQKRVKKVDDVPVQGPSSGLGGYGERYYTQVTIQLPTRPDGILGDRLCVMMYPKDV